MIKKTLLYFLLVLSIYSLLANTLQWQSKSLTQWEDNEQLISKFLFSTNHNQLNTIIVGSSMAFRMTVKENPYRDTVYNLSLGGHGIFDGLEILKRSGFIPKHLLIESNLIYKEPRQNYAVSFFTPGIYQLKQWVPGFRQEYRPITFCQYLYFGIKGKYKQIFVQNNLDKLTFTDDTNIETFIKTKDATKQMHLETLQQNYTKVLRETDWQNIEHQIKFYVDYFIQKGSIVYFFEMPSDTLLLKSELNKHIRNMLINNYPSLLIINAEASKTTDGVHIEPDLAHNYLKRLLIMIK